MPQIQFFQMPGGTKRITTKRKERKEKPLESLIGAAMVYLQGRQMYERIQESKAETELRKRQEERQSIMDWRNLQSGRQQEGFQHITAGANLLSDYNQEKRLVMQDINIINKQPLLDALEEKYKTVRAQSKALTDKGFNILDLDIPKVEDRPFIGKPPSKEEFSEADIDDATKSLIERGSSREEINETRKVMGASLLSLAEMGEIKTQIKEGKFRGPLAVGAKVAKFGVDRLGEATDLIGGLGLGAAKALGMQTDVTGKWGDIINRMRPDETPWLRQALQFGGRQLRQGGAAIGQRFLGRAAPQTLPPGISPLEQESTRMRMERMGIPQLGGGQGAMQSYLQRLMQARRGR